MKSNDFSLINSLRIGENITLNDDGGINSGQFMNFSSDKMTEDEITRLRDFNPNLYVRGAHDPGHLMLTHIGLAIGLHIDPSKTDFFSIVGEDIADFLGAAAHGYDRSVNPIHFNEANPSNTVEGTVDAIYYGMFKERIIQNSPEEEQQRLREEYSTPTLRSELYDQFTSQLSEIFPEWRKAALEQLETEKTLWILSEIIQTKYPSILSRFSEVVEQLSEWEKNPINMESEIFNPEKLLLATYEVSSQSRKTREPFDIEQIINILDNPQKFNIEDIQHASILEKWRNDDQKYYVPHLERKEFFLSLAMVLDNSLLEKLELGDHTFEVQYGLSLDEKDLPDRYKIARADPEISILVDKINRIIDQYPEVMHNGRNIDVISQYQPLDYRETIVSMSPQERGIEILLSEYFLAQILENKQNFYKKELDDDRMQNLRNSMGVDYLIEKIKTIKEMEYKIEGNEQAQTLTVLNESFLHANPDIAEKLESLKSLEYTGKNKIERDYDIGSSLKMVNAVSTEIVPASINVIGATRGVNYNDISYNGRTI